MGLKLEFKERIVLFESFIYLESKLLEAFKSCKSNLSLISTSCLEIESKLKAAISIMQDQAFKLL